MNRRQVTTAMVLGGATLALGKQVERRATALAGGWASLELINPLRIVVVGVPTVIDAQVLLHGITPSTFLPGAIRFLNEESGDEQIVNLDVISEACAILRGEVTLDQPGPYRMQTWEMGPPIELDSVEAIAPVDGEVISALAPATEMASACASGDVAGTVETDIFDASFADPLLEVPAGTIVTWTNTSVIPHQIIFDGQEHDGSSMLHQEDTFSTAFDVAGEFAYHCAPHPYMKGVVRVA